MDENSVGPDHSADLDVYRESYMSVHDNVSRKSVNH